ncbi:hypothetical protein ACIBUY_04010 [Streptomyces sp. NPDC050085]|uniref:hypothetical protein n=1 Tax=Streptomyces sp. NPDC050085 TaxID=3365600 RepID=UPI0037AD77CB
MNKTATRLPADPGHLHLRYTLVHGLLDDPHERTLEAWKVSIRHGYEVHDVTRCPAPGEEAGDCLREDCPALQEDGVEIGHMAFYRARLAQGATNAFWAMEEESQELSEIAEVLLDPATGYFTEDAGQQLAYAGTDLLVMDQVVLVKPWRGLGLGTVFAAEAISRLGIGCRAIACVPGISDYEDDWRPQQAEWDRITARITSAWQRVGFTLYRDGVYLLEPNSEAAEEHLAAARVAFHDLCAAWRTTAPD